MQSPQWFHHAIIYHIFLDRFAGFTTTEGSEHPIFLGGNIQGIREKLSYLQDLGVNTIWISPFYQTNTYHGYHITNFFTLDPHFGTLDDLKQLIHEAHQRHLHVITDFVPNHCSRDHPFFQDAIKNKHSIYHDWFIFTQWPDQYQCFLHVHELPK